MDGNSILMKELVNTDTLTKSQSVLQTKCWNLSIFIK